MYNLSKFLYIFLFIVLLLLTILFHYLDLNLSLDNLSPETELNPIASWIWETYDNTGIVILKTIGISISLISTIFLFILNKRAGLGLMIFIACISAVPLLLFMAIL